MGKTYEMLMDGKKVIATEEKLKKETMREKKVEVTIGDRTVRVMEHMLSDAAKFGATRTKKITKDVPKELITVPEIIKGQVEEVKPEPEKSEPIGSIRAFDKIVRKTPVRSKSTKK